jgi:hypothetical protein
MENFDEVREKLKNWRMMKKQTLDSGINNLIEN